MPQPSILSHPSVGCFVSHSGYGSMWESLTTDPQMVLLPEYVNYIFNARLLADELKLVVEVEKDENGLVSKERLCDAIKSVMDEESEIAMFLGEEESCQMEGNPGQPWVYEQSYRQFCWAIARSSSGSEMILLLRWKQLHC